MSDQLQEPRVALGQLLEAVGDDAAAAEKLLREIFSDLKQIARNIVAGERKNHTLQATALVNEFYMRLVGGGNEVRDRAHLNAIAAEVMRYIVIDYARARARRKRGGGRERVDLEMTNIVDLAARGDPEQVMAVEAAVSKLEASDPEGGQVVRLRFYAGLSVKEVAATLEMSEKSVQRRWQTARLRLFKLLSENEAPE
jgi:RNA polymerase sigma factor (TIGR02999 family)